MAAPVPFHGENSPISTPTEADEEVFEEGEEEDENEEDPPLQREEDTQDSVRKREQTSQGQTTAWASVVDFNGNWSQFREHEAVINAQARDWLGEAAQETRDSLPNTKEPPYYGVHVASRASEQPRKADKDPNQQYLDDSTDLLGLGGMMHQPAPGS